MPPTSLSSTDPHRLRRFLLFGLRWTISCLLLLAAAKQIFHELQKLRGRELHFSLPLLLLAGPLYAAGLACFGAYWRRTAMQMGGKMGVLESQRAYFASQLGKYVPGKAWVVLIRCWLTHRSTAAIAVIVASTLYETLAMMSAASLLALVALLLAGIRSAPLLLTSGGLGAGLCIAALPPVFRRLASWASKPFQREERPLISAIGYKTWIQGLCYFLPGWLLVGASVMVTAASVGAPLTRISDLPLATGSIALSMSAGFAVFLVPAGLGVREWILMQALGPSIGAANAGLVAVLARIMNIASELLVAGFLYPLRMRQRVS